MKTRNPVAGNSYRYNKPKVIKDKKKQLRKYACRNSARLTQR